MLWAILIGAVVLGFIVIVSGGENAINMLLYGKPVFTDVSSETMRAAEDKLRSAGVKYTTSTIKDRPTMLRGRDSSAYYSSNLVYNEQTDRNSFVYRIFVSRSKRQEALEALK